jgi:hypothetical protein
MEELLIIERNQGGKREVTYAGVPLTLAEYVEKMPEQCRTSYSLHLMGIINQDNSIIFRIRQKTVNSGYDVIVEQWRPFDVQLTPEVKEGLLRLLQFDSS